MILHSVGREFRPWNEYAKAIRAELDRQSPAPLDVQEHSLVEAHDGQISAENHNRQGALFRIRLPLAHSPASALAAS